MAANNNEVPIGLTNPSCPPALPTSLPAANETELAKCDSYSALLHNSTLILYTIANGTSTARTRYQLFQSIAQFTPADKANVAPFSKEKAIIEDTIQRIK
jgi:hypothetical protein